MIRDFIGDVIGALCLCALAYMLLGAAAILSPCDPSTEQCETGEKP